MTSFVLCPCGHGLERHGAGGCKGDLRTACACHLDESGALNAAVGEAGDRRGRKAGHEDLETASNEHDQR